MCKRCWWGCFNAKQLFCGDNFTFGARAAGNVERLAGALRAPRHQRMHIVPMAQYGGRPSRRPASAPRWRRAVSTTPTPCSAHPIYAIDWPVVHGKGIGSGKWAWHADAEPDYPAAALQPCAGVYLTRIYLDGQWRPAATGIGKRPTVDSSENAAVTCETFVPDFSGNVYGSRCWNFTNISARCASSIPWTSWPR